MSTKKFGLRHALLVTCASMGAIAAATPAVALAQQTATRQYAIEPQSLDAALREFALQTGRDVLFSPEVVAGKTSPGAQGSLDEAQALNAILDGTGLEARLTRTQGYVVQDQSSPTRLGAASPAASSDDEEAEEAIVVTGTRIPRSNMNSPIPTQVIGSQDIQSSGATDLGEILTQIPGIDFNLSAEGTHTDTQNSGLSVIELRNLGGNRTLTLIDGRRAISNSGNSQRVSTSTIPAGFIDRIEVTTGGASAVYGSDAIAGVVNVILDDDYDGVRLGGRYGWSQDGGEEEATIEALLGRNFANGRGNVMAFLSYEDETAVDATDRDWSTVPVTWSGGALVSNLSGNIPGGRFEGSDAWNDEYGWHNDINLPPNGEAVARDFSTQIDGYNLRPDQVISPPRERWLAAFKGHYDFSNTLRGFASIQYAWEETFSAGAAETASSTTSFGPFDNLQTIGQMSSTHPFIPPEVQATQSGTISWVRRFNELGRITRTSERETWRSWAGFEGSIFGDWRWEAYLGYGHFTQDQVRDNAGNFENIRFALNIEADPGNPGQYRCVDAGARAAGCVPLNLFGIGSITPDMAAYIRATDNTRTELEQTTAAANLVGTLFQLPAGPVQAAFGVEFRREEQTTDGDPVTQSEVTGHAFIADISGDYDVQEVFAEVNVPLLRDQPFAHRLSAEAALRFASYSHPNIDTVESWKFGLSWSPIPDLTLRGQISRAQRAPDITELFSSLRGDFDTVSDPCNGVTLASTGTVAQNCLADPGVLAEVNLNGVFMLDDTNIFGPNSGNMNLQEETANTTTFGFILAPRAVPGFSLIVDYYNIEVEDAISSIESDTILDLCYSSDNYPNNVFCDAVTRNAADGEIDRIVNRSENLNQLVSEGVDTTLAFEFEPGIIPGELDFRLIHSYIATLDTTFIGPTGALVTESSAGQVGTSEHQFRATLGWTNGPLRLRWTTRYIGDAVDDLALAPTDANYLEVDADAQRPHVQYTGSTTPTARASMPASTSSTTTGRSCRRARTAAGRGTTTRLTIPSDAPSTQASAIPGDRLLRRRVNRMRGSWFSAAFAVGMLMLTAAALGKTGAKSAISCWRTYRPKRKPTARCRQLCRYAADLRVPELAHRRERPHLPAQRQSLCRRHAATGRSPASSTFAATHRATACGAGVRLARLRLLARRQR
ncbi:MAG: TonB-dependent receptor [Hyphomonadaceae bacterium]